MDVLASRPAVTAAAVASSLLAAALIRQALAATTTMASSSSRQAILPSPRSTLLPHLSPTALSLLPYPPDALPGARDVLTPYGTVKVFEFGPATGERVLLLPGLSTPCITLGNLATSLAARGFRVMLFDYFGRGWSDTPDPDGTDHDERLYMTQILCVLASSETSWLGDAAPPAGSRGSSSGGFHLVGYSFGGGLAVSFASYLPRVVRSVTLIAPGGLMPWSGNSWRTRMLYFTRGLLPDAILHHLVRKRFEPAVPASSLSDDDDDDDNQAAMLVEQAELGSDPFDSAVVATRKRGGGDKRDVKVTVADIMAWQLRHHQGFVPAVMSAFRYGPIHERFEEWGRLGDFLAAARRRHCGQNGTESINHQERRHTAAENPAGLLNGKVLLVLGDSDPIVTEKFLVPEMKRVLGEDAVEVVVLDAGHEVAITKGLDIANAAIKFWGDAIDFSVDKVDI